MGNCRVVNYSSDCRSNPKTVFKCFALRQVWIHGRGYGDMPSPLKILKNNFR